jgi:hypothetical protein
MNVQDQRDDASSQPVRAVEPDKRARVDRILKLVRGDAQDDTAADDATAVDRLPDVERARFDQRKLTDYSLNPDHPQNRGKAAGWRALGYDVDSEAGRADDAKSIEAAVRREIPKAAAKRLDTDERGQRWRTEHEITGPNGRTARS